MGYRVVVITPLGPRCLNRGRLVAWQHARWYHHPSSAKVALAGFRKRWGDNTFVTHILKWKEAIPS